MRTPEQTAERMAKWVKVRDEPMTIKQYDFDKAERNLHDRNYLFDEVERKAYASPVWPELWATINQSLN